MWLKSTSFENDCSTSPWYLLSEVKYANMQRFCNRGSTAVSCGRESQRTEHGGHLGGSQQREWDRAQLSWFPASSVSKTIL